MRKAFLRVAKRGLSADAAKRGLSADAAKRGLSAPIAALGCAPEDICEQMKRGDA